MLVDIVPTLQRLPGWLLPMAKSGWLVSPENSPTSYRAHRHLVDRNETHNLSWVQLCYVVDEPSMATNITAALALRVFVMASVQHPDAVRKAQRELDSAVGPDWLPGFADVAPLAAHYALWGTPRSHR
ncbi:hypothetical protein P168DRAFT_283208 [Aspergillus campestris IBT 28561]|uniref:Cytochrome P450 n=1 Tax=Aspergillus campestris (strain IBT 28561) TaxID=1392248 RepID=A0A2I1CXU8_ASPC2|nr:uncharacterized protein P168DRAFT_283208 [Aspergillus campestris IBT 28561]PKY02422.1 hypothetical protein P168DRAFT_283208 [Aspergillus campestris IBT 28561]